ncbi:Tn3 family transposase [Streptomyces chartreusis]
MPEQHPTQPAVRGTVPETFLASLIGPWARTLPGPLHRSRFHGWLNFVICWHTEYLGLAVDQLRGDGREVDDDVLAHISPARSQVVNYYGSITVDYGHEVAQLDEQGHRPLRTDDEWVDSR